MSTLMETPWRLVVVAIAASLIVAACASDAEQADGDGTVTVDDETTPTTTEPAAAEPEDEPIDVAEFAAELAALLDQEAIDLDAAFAPIIDRLGETPEVAWYVELCTAGGPIRRATYESMRSIEAPSDLAGLYDEYVTARLAFVDSGEAVCDDLVADPSEAEAAVDAGDPIFVFVEPLQRPQQDAEAAVCFELQALLAELTPEVLNCIGIPPGAE